MPPVWVVRRWRGRARRIGTFNPLTNRVERATLGVAVGDEEGSHRGPSGNVPPRPYRFPWPYLSPESVDKFPGAFYGDVVDPACVGVAWGR